MTDKVQKIREEVARLQNELIQEKEKGFGSNVDDACILELQNILTYIDSLQEEPVSEDLEKEVNKYFHALYSGWTDEQRKEDFLVEELCTNVARHFANWQKNKMTTFGWKRATEELNIGCIIWDESRHLHLYSDIVTKGQLYISMADILSLPGGPKEKEE